jgi:transcriptional regulator with XRE-family HTH domain
VTRMHRSTPEDQVIGSNIRLLRVQSSMSQGALAAVLGVSFQQLQKYERAQNRISAGSLWRLGLALAMPVSLFYQGLDQPLSSYHVPAEQLPLCHKQARRACYLLERLETSNEREAALQTLDSVVQAMHCVAAKTPILKDGRML